MKYTAVVSSDWNECLAPCGPFDPISFMFPELAPQLSEIFELYTGNDITLTEATRRIAAIMPGSISEEHMDSYLEASFVTYRGVPDLIEWCRDHNILFMINTTGMQGYFQRVSAKKLIPKVPVIAANPLIQFPGAKDDPRYFLTVMEIEDKPKNTEIIMRAHGVPPSRVIVIGDSGGDGPHFEWAAAKGAFRIGSMTKPSLHAYCKRRGIVVHRRFGLSYSTVGPRDLERELQVDFKDLIHVIETLFDLPVPKG